MKISKLMDLFEKKGIKTLKYSEKDIDKIKKPIVVKADTTEHKTDKKLVFVNLCNEKEIREKIKYIKSQGFDVLIQPQINGIELILGIKKDETFDYVVMFGAGGILTELYKDVSFRKIPLNREEIKKMIKETKISKIFEGFRNKKYDIEKVIKIIEKMIEIVQENNFKEFEINPLIINEEDAYIVDVRAIKF